MVKSRESNLGSDLVSFLQVSQCDKGPTVLELGVQVPLDVSTFYFYDNGPDRASLSG